MRARHRSRRADGNPSLLTRSFFVLGLVVYAFVLQFSTDRLGSIDGYFHIRYSAILRESGWAGFPPPFPWLPLTILSDDRYFDHHMLFHVWLALFTTGDLITGAKLASALGAAAAFVAAYGVLVARGIRRAEWWAVALLAAAPGFLFRMEMPRVQAWSLVFLLLAFELMIRKRHVWLFPLAWLYTWLYDAFPFLLALCGCAAMAEWLLRRTITWQPITFAALGITAGLLINPYFPRNVTFIAHHYLAKVEIGSIPVGREWYPMPVAEWLGWAGLVAIFTAFAVLLCRRRAQLEVPELTSTLMAALFFGLLWRSSRFVEYFVPFGVIALAQISHDRIDSLLRSMSPRPRRWVGVVLIVCLAVSTTVASVFLSRRPPPTRYAQASDWIRANTPAGSIVYTPGWDDFPLLYFHNTQNRYVIGLDPTYLAERDGKLYGVWRRISDGEEKKPASMIREHYGAVAALTDHAHQGFIAAMDNDPQARRVYQDGDCIVYALVSAP
jgi:hypothetical protein